MDCAMDVYTTTLLAQKHLYSLGEVKEIESQEERYDIGCYQKHDELAEKGNALELIKQGARVPFCIEGGMFRVNRCCQLNY